MSEEVITLPVVHAVPAARKTARAETSDAPRIVQWLNAETADRLMSHCSGKSRPALPILALDNEGHTWSLEYISEDSPVESERGRLTWRRLWVPPLPGEAE